MVCISSTTSARTRVCVCVLVHAAQRVLGDEDLCSSFQEVSPVFSVIYEGMLEAMRRMYLYAKHAFSTV